MERLISYLPKIIESLIKFKNRIIFPVKSLNHNIFALGGRALSKKSFAKYINSPETEFYKKGNNLYNINSAKEFRSKYDEVFIVEGYMDVINFPRTMMLLLLLSC